MERQREYRGVAAVGLLVVVCSALVVVQHRGWEEGTLLLSNHGGLNNKPEDVSLKVCSLFVCCVYTQTYICTL